MPTLIRTFGVIALAIMVAGCAGRGPAVADVAPASSAVSDSASEYIIGPGDQLQIFVFRNEDISATVPVRPDGRISTPLVEDMQAVGKTPSQLARDIELRLEEYIRSPQVNVIVLGFVGTFGEQIRVVGQAAQPQALAYRDGMTLLDVVIEVGGLTEFASGNRARIVRSTGGSQREIRVRLNDLVNRGDMSQNVAMRPGDVLVIPGSFF
jgi:polysaccharide biosynthesis/export protein